MIVDGVFKGAWWLDEIKEPPAAPMPIEARKKLVSEIEAFMSAQGLSLDDGIWYLLEALDDETR